MLLLKLDLLADLDGVDDEEQRVKDQTEREVEDLEAGNAQEEAEQSHRQHG